MYSQFAAKTTSEKLTAAWIEPSQRLVATWSLDAGSVWKASVDYWVIRVTVLGTTLTAAASRLAMVAGSYFFDSTQKKIYVWLSDSTSPKLSHTEVVYRLFFADGPIDLPFDLDAGRSVPYLPYLSDASSGASQFDPNKPQLPIEGNGRVNLLNDGFFTPIFDRLTWQTKRAAVFSVSRDGDSKKLYEGLVTTKSFNGNVVSFGLKDELYKLRSKVDLPLYSSDDGILSDALLGKPKRRIYGRVAGLKAESIDQTLAGYLVSTISSDARTGTPVTFNLTTGSAIATASSADVKRDVAVGDRITINEVDFKVKTLSRREFGLSGEKDVTFSQPVSTSQLRISFVDIDLTRLATGQHLAVSRLANGSAILNSALFGVSPIVSIGADYFDVSLDTAYSVGTVVVKVASTEMCVVIPSNDTTFQLSEVSVATKVNLTGRVKPAIAYRRLNRALSIAHHALHEVTATVVTVKRGNLFELSTIQDLTVGDTLIFDGDKVTEIDSIDPNNNTVTTVNLVNPLPQAGESVVRVAVQGVTFNNLEFVPLRDYTVSNIVSGSTCQLATTAEREVTSSETIGNIVWQGSGKVVVGGGSIFDGLYPRDWIKPSSDSDWYEIEEVFSSGILIVVESYTGASGTKASMVKKPAYIGDKSNVLVDTYGITQEGTAGGTLIRTAPDAVKHLLTEAGLAAIDSTSFAEASEDAAYLVSYVMPPAPRNQPPSYRTAIDELNASVLGVTFVSEDFTLKYRVLSAKREASVATYLTDYDVIDFKQKADSSTIYRKIVASYRHQDLDPILEEETSLVVESESQFVENSEIDGQVYTTNLYLYDQKAAETVAARLMFFNELPKTELSLSGSLNLSSLFLTDLVLFRADSLYSRYGSTDSAIIGLVTASNKSGQNAKLVVSDLGNIFSRSAVIAENGTPAYSSATADQKRFSGFITDDGGIISSDDEVGTNLIS
jgi:hypothetical protein